MSSHVSPVQSVLGRLRQLFSGLTGNARVIVVTEGISGIAFAWYGFYLPLYMVALGVSELQVGLLASVMMASRMLATFLGGYFADRFGRKRVLVITDIICWGIPLALYAIADNPWYFVIGRFVNGLVYLVLPSFDCLFVEDVPLEKRQFVFGAMRFLMASDAFFVPIAGLIVARWGMVAGGRAIMAIAALVAVIISLSRGLLLRETSMGRQRMAETAKMPLNEILAQYCASIGALFRSRSALHCLAVRYAAVCGAAAISTYATIYMADGRGLGLSESLISVLPFVSAVVTVVLLTAAVHRLHPEHEQGNLWLGMAISASGTIALLIAPHGGLVAPVVWAVCSALATGLFQPAIQSRWANVVPDADRAQAYSLGTALESLLVLPFAPLAGWLYTSSPRWAFALGLALQLGCLALIVLGRREARDRPIPDVAP